MYPTISDGDRVRVQLCVNGSLINVGDIIVYSTIATGVNPGYMWIGHRVVEKYEKGNAWWFKTKGDNNPEPDSWEVPEYWLLGLVVSIDHAERSYVPSQTSSQSEQADTTYTETPFSGESQTLLLIVGSLVLGMTAVAFNKLRHRKQATLLKKANVYSCYSCGHYEIQYIRKLESINGRIGIRRTPDFSKGFCKYCNVIIEDFPRRNCGQYEPKIYA